MKKSLLSLLILLGCLHTGGQAEAAWAQKTGKEIPFQLMRNKIILPVSVNGSRELKVILDTGMPGTGLLLFRKEVGEELNLRGGKRYLIRGAGQGETSYAIRIENRELRSGEATFPGQNILVLQNDTMQGFLTDGVIGYTVFGSGIVEIDYDSQRITLFDHDGFRPGPGWETLDLTFKRNIPWLKARVEINPGQEFSAEMYIDMASSEALEMLIKPDMKFTLPPGLEKKFIGRGLSGDITGHFGSIPSLTIGSHVLRGVPTVFPTKEARSRQEGADGILSNNALRRFNLVFDYARKKLYIKPNKTFGLPFTH